MKCDWCKEDAVRSDIASQRCAACGGAHWSCPTPGCGRTIGENRAFCSACGAERCYPRLNGQSKPEVMICTAAGYPIVADASAGRGFHARNAEGYSHEGRLIVAGPKQVFVAPNPLPKTGDRKALGLVCEASPEEGVFSTPSSLPGGAMILSTRQRILAVSLHSGETRTVGATGSAIRPVVRRLSSDRTGPADVWIWTPGSTDMPLTRLMYEPGECLEPGRFKEVSKHRGLPGTVVGTLGNERTPDGIPNIWFFAGQDKKEACMYGIDPTSDTPVESASWNACVLPRLPGERTSLWLSENSEEKGWFWLSRGGWEDDGALPVQKVLANKAQELEFMAFGDSFADRLRGVKLAEVRLAEYPDPAMDRTWIRTTPRMRWGWCGDEEKIRLACTGKGMKWDDDALLGPLDNKFAQEFPGPLIPTKWGFAAIVAERPNIIRILYFDFPKA